MNSYLTLFSFLRLLIIGAYLFFESKNQPIGDYFQVNWLNWPPSSSKTLIKKKIAECAKWDSFRMNIFSISLLMGCEFLNCLGNIWIYYVCINFGIIENVISLLKGLAIVVVTIPLLLDICYTLL